MTSLSRELIILIVSSRLFSGDLVFSRLFSGDLVFFEIIFWYVWYVGMSVCRNNDLVTSLSRNNEIIRK